MSTFVCNKGKHKDKKQAGREIHVQALIIIKGEKGGNDHHYLVAMMVAAAVAGKYLPVYAREFLKY